LAASTASVPPRCDTRMRLNAYLSSSRLGMFYFRWPVPSSPDQPKLTTVRLSLRTRCPRQAREMALYLAAGARTSSLPVQPVSRTRMDLQATGRLAGPGQCEGVDTGQ